MLIRRYIQGSIEKDLGDKMVFVAGPHQAGKTTSAKQILDAGGAGTYEEGAEANRPGYLQGFLRANRAESG